MPLALLGALLILLAACAGAPQRHGPTVPGDYRYPDAYLDWMIGAEMKKAHVTGLSIAIVDDQRIVWAKGYGYCRYRGRSRRTGYPVSGRVHLEAAHGHGGDAQSRPG